MMARWFLLLVVLGIQGKLMAQAPQFSQFFSNPLYANPALAGDAGAPRFIANYRTQWASLGAPFQTSAISFDTYAKDAGVGLGFRGLHDNRGGFLQANQLAAQASKLVYIDGQKNLRLIGGLEAAWVSNRWNGENITYVSDLLGATDPLSTSALTENRLGFSAGTLLEYVPQQDYAPSMWLGAAWHNIGVTNQKWMGQNVNLQAGTQIRMESPAYFGNYLGKDLDREFMLTLAAQYRRQGPNQQMDTGVNLVYSPLIIGVWYRGTFLSSNRHDAMIGTAGWARDNMLIQVSYDLPISSLGYNTAAFELSIWYGLNTLFSFTGKAYHERRAVRTPRY